MEASFNLVDEPWIPCIPLDGGPIAEVGITEALTNASAYKEIYDNSPLVTVSLHRLLLAILYRACGPTNLREARGLLRDGLPKDAIRSYLDKYHDRFNLFDEEYPFYQTGHLKMDSLCCLNRLATELATGNNTTLFDHTSDMVVLNYSCAEAARLLVAAQSFALGFGKSSQATIKGEKIAPPYSADAILLRGVTVWLTDNNLASTLLLNLVPMEPTNIDLPCWERDCSQELRDTVVNGQKQTRSADGVVDRYTWQSRLIRLLPTCLEGNMVVCEAFFTQGRSADKSPDDPMKAYIKDEKEGFVPVALSASKSAWRDSHAILATNSSMFKRPSAFNYVADMIEKEVMDAESELAVNVVGLATAPGKAGKFTLWRHDRIPMPARLLRDNDLVERLGGLLNGAEQIGRSLRFFTRELCRNFLSLGGRNPDPKDIDSLSDKIDPRRDYWAKLEGHFYTLLRELPVEKEAASEGWYTAITKEAYAAFNRSTDQLGQSARAIRARALVYPGFDPRKATANPKEKEVMV